MRIADVMEHRVEVADASMPADRAWAHMRRRGLQLYLVTDPSGPVGIVTREQLGGRGGEGNRCDRVLGQFVKGGPVYATPDTDVTHAAKALRPRLEGCLQIWQDGRLAGVITLAHLLDLVARLVRESRRRRPPRSRQPAPAAGGAGVTQSS